MNTFLYIIIFIMGSVFGSFLTLATYRIPLNDDITHKHSYCPKCNHKLNFLDMIPILSYILLRGRCRYCKTKISPRYIIIEILSGIAFILLAIGLNVNIYTIKNATTIINFVLGVLYIVFLFLVAGIDKEHNKVDKGVLIYGFILAILNSIYEYFYSENINLNRIVIYLIMLVIVLMINLMQMKKKGKDQYSLNILIVCIIMALITYEIATIISIVFTLLIVAVKNILKGIFKIKSRTNLQFAFYLCVSNVLSIILIYIIS